MNKQIMLAAVFFLFSAFPVLAQEYNETIALQVIPVAPEVEVGGMALFTLAITNLGPERDVFKISGDPSDVSPFSNSVQYIQVEPNQIKLDPNQMKEVQVKVKVMESAIPDSESQVDVKVSSLSHQEITESTSLKAFVVSAKDVVQINVDAPSDVMPGDLYTFVILLKNRPGALALTLATTGLVTKVAQPETTQPEASKPTQPEASKPSNPDAGKQSKTK